MRNQSFQGIISADEYNLNESFKGKSPKKTIEEDRYFYNFEYEDLSRCVGWTFRNCDYLLKNPQKYLKPVQVKISTAMDRNGHVLTRIVENPPLVSNINRKYQDIVSFFEGKLDKNSTICAFSSGLYREAAFKLNVKFKKARSRMKDLIYSVHHVHMYNHKLSRWLSNFHGVATKYLNNYLSWHAFLFMLQEVNEISRISRLFTEITTINLSVTQKQIQNRKVEFI